MLRSFLFSLMALVMVVGVGCLEAAELQEFFSEYDQDGNQQITLEEIVKKLKQDDIDNNF